MFDKILKGLTIITAFAATIGSAFGTRITLNMAKGSTFSGGCDNTFEYTEKSSFELPKEIRGGQPNCLMGDGSLRNICTGEIIRNIDLQKYNIKIQPAKNSIAEDGIYEIQAGKIASYPKNCHHEVKIKKNIPVSMKKGQKLMFMGNGMVIDRISGAEIKQLQKGKDYEISKIKEQSLSDEEMAAVYQHNRDDEILPKYKSI